MFASEAQLKKYFKNDFFKFRMTNFFEFNFTLVLSYVKLKATLSQQLISDLNFFLVLSSTYSSQRCPTPAEVGSDIYLFSSTDPCKICQVFPAGMKTFRSSETAWKSLFLPFLEWRKTIHFSQPINFYPIKKTFLSAFSSLKNNVL